jgi:hypothetical protein
MEHSDMETMIVAVVATLSLGAGAAYAQGVPAGSAIERPYGAQAFTEHPNDKQISFRDSVLGRMIHYNSTDTGSRVAATTSPKG